MNYHELGVDFWVPTNMKTWVRKIIFLIVAIAVFPVWAQGVSPANCSKVNREINNFCDKSNKGDGAVCSEDPHNTIQFILGELNITPPRDMPEGGQLVRGLKEHLSACMCIEISPCRLGVITERMNEYLELKGYSYARAIIPKQSISGIDARDGYSLKVDLYQPIVSGTKLENAAGKDYSSLSWQEQQAIDNAQRQLEQSFRQNSILTQNAIDHGIHDLSGISGIVLDYDKIQTLQGTKKSPFDIVFDKASPEKRTIDYQVILRPDTVKEPAYDFALNNYGTNYTENANDKLNFDLNFFCRGCLNPLDSLRFSWSKTIIGTNSFHTGVLWFKPISGLGVGSNFSINLDYFRYKIQGDFELVNAHGSVATIGSNLTIPMTRTDRYSNYLYIKPEYKLLSDQQANDNFNNTRRLFSARGGIQTTGLKNVFLTSNVNYFIDTSLMLGFNFLVTPEVANLDDNPASGHSKGGLFLKPSGLLKITTSTKQFDRIIKISSVFQGQFTSKNLDSSEKFSLGGPLTVRGYPVGHVSADEALVINGEIASPINESYQAFFTVDGAVGSVYKNPIPGVDVQNNKKLASYGLGVEGLVEGVFFRAEIGVPTQNNAATQAWLRVNYKF